MLRGFAVLGLAAGLIWGFALRANDDNRSLGDRTRQYLTDLVRLDTSNPPGNETKVAEYLKKIADANGIPAELIGNDPRRLNFVARLKGSGKARPLLMLAHSDVVPAERAQWSADPFGAELRNGYIWGRGTQDSKNLLAAEMAVLVEIKRRNLKLERDLILVAEADEEGGSSGIQYLIQRAWPKIDADIAINEGGSIFESKDGTLVFEVQTAEKIPTRIQLTAHGTAGHGSLPRSDNPVVHLARALTKLADAEQPVKLGGTTRRYMREISKLSEYSWIAPLIPRLESPALQAAAAQQIRARDPELDAMLHTTVVPTMLKSGIRVNVIPNTAEAQADVRRLPGENRDEVLARLRLIVNDPLVELNFSSGPQMPTTDPSPLSSILYKAIETAISVVYPRDTLIVPLMSRGATDSSYLRARGVAVYGVPLFEREATDLSHGNDERISSKSVEDGAELLWHIVIEAANTEN